MRSSSLLQQKRRAAIASSAAFPAPAARRSGSRALVRPAQNNNSTPRRASHSGEGRRVEKEARLGSSELEMGRAREGVVPALADGEMTFLSIAF
ncbi:hypothetical protein MRX96_051735 [Rhipicephalus microplus]